MKTLPPKPNTPAADLALLEEKRRAMRREALAYLEEADRLDALYAAVTGHDPAAAAQDEVLS
jgi:hypothetical protein